VDKRPLFKIDRDSGIPLIGSIAFGLIDRGTNIIQVRPITGCPLNCIFCSIDEGPNSRTRWARYYVELDYLLEWFKWLVKLKGGKGIEAHIDCAGEPTLYPELVDLVQALREVEGVEVISMQTHGTLLNERKIDELEDAGMSRINLSIDSMDPDKAKLLSGSQSYDLSKILGLAEYIASSKIDLMIAPVWVPGYNDEDIPKIIEFALKIGAGKKWPPLGIQKYEAHKRGRKPVKSWPYSLFYEKLRALERRYNVKLRITKRDFNVHPLPTPPIPFEKGEAIKVKIVGPGWLYDEALGVSRGRAVTLVGLPYFKEGIEVKAIVKSVKHNIIVAKPTEKSLMMIKELLR